MQQRVVISMALACNPNILIADEPTSNLDVTIQAQILDLIEKLKGEYKSSILFITHDLGVVAEIASKVIVLYAGALVEFAPVRELFKNPLHPYTKALLNSVPKLERRERLESIRGNVPNLVDPPAGCRFHPRCPDVMDICRSSKPEQIINRTHEGQVHSVACFLYKP
ncbi:Oligopeptide transport ATP-binding protein OppD [subsurface metagenome]